MASKSKKAKMSSNKPSRTNVIPGADSNNSRQIPSASPSFNFTHHANNEADTKNKLYFSDKMSREDNIYLVSVIGEPLTQCLAELVTKAPIDPLEWIAHWLYNYTNAKTYNEEKAKFLDDLEKARIALKQEEKLRRKKIRHMRDEQHELMKALAKMRPGQVMDGRRLDSLLTFDSHSRRDDSDSKEASHDTHRTGHTSAKSKSFITGSRTFSKGDHSGKRSQRFHSDGTAFTYEEALAAEVAERKATMLKEKGFRMTESGTLLHLDGTVLSTEEMSEFRRSMEDLEKQARIQAESTEKIRSASGRLYHKDGRPYSEKELAKANSKRKQEQRFVTATWGVDCRLALVCRHPILGDMQPRPPMVFPETPEVWEEKGYTEKTLYDHECYSRNVSNDVPNDDWKNMEPLTYAEVTETGPWLASGFSPKFDNKFCSSRIKAEKNSL